MNINEEVKIYGEVERIIQYEDGRIETSVIKNTILTKGREALSKTLGNFVGDTPQFFITRMLFGDGGTQDGVKKYVNEGRNGLFGVTRLTKPVISGLDAQVNTKVIFTSVINFDEANDVTLNEMALQMASGDLYSMLTFNDLNKSSDMSITFNWRINFV